ncbi:hypothetical protein NBRC116494_07550 [Aurantivibrio plasticivorans]
MQRQTSTDSAKRRAGEVASAMLQGSMPYLKGVIELVSLREALGIYENDPDFFAFTGVLAEINNLPLGSNPDNWTDENIAKHRDVISESEKWAKAFSSTQCRAIAERFG